MVASATRSQRVLRGRHPHRPGILAASPRRLDRGQGRILRKLIVGEAIPTDVTRQDDVVVEWGGSNSWAIGMQCCLNTAVAQLLAFFPIHAGRSAPRLTFPR
jgi:hypothetical protein